MRIKKYNQFITENIQKKDISEIVDEILDSLSKKKKLSKSEKEFMDAAAKGEVLDASVPKMTGNFWSDMANPHNIGTLWVGSDGVWKQIKTIEDEEDEEDEDSDVLWERKKKRSQEKYLEKLPELKEILIELIKSKIESKKIENQISSKLRSLANKLDNDSKYDFNQKLDYCFKGLDSIQNQFGYILPELKFNDDTGEFYLDN
jgi:phosphoglycolate phosphatase-like HAD superfamily hydrolase